MKVFKRLVAIFCAIITFSYVSISAHDVHISYCQATIEKNVLKGKVTYYRDDFEKALMNWAGNKPLTGNEHWQAKLKFLKEQFRATANDKYVPINITGSGIDETSIWFDFTFTAEAPITIVNIEHTTLFKEYNDQMNLIGIKTANKEFSHIFTPSKKTFSVKL